MARNRGIHVTHVEARGLVHSLVRVAPHLPRFGAVLAAALPTRHARRQGGAHRILMNFTVCWPSVRLAPRQRGVTGPCAGVPASDVRIRWLDYVAPMIVSICN